MKSQPSHPLAGSLSVCLLAAAATVAHAQNLLPNPGFEAGSQSPSDWRLSGGQGQWSSPGRTGQHAVRVEGTGDDQSDWRLPAPWLEPATLYRFRFWGRREPNSSSGTAVSGPTRVNRDFVLDESWREQSYVFRTPDDLEDEIVRLGEWHVRGRMSFDDVELLPVRTVHTRLPGGGELGEAESIRGGVYRFSPQLGWHGANFHRPLLVNRAAFNSDRWIFSDGAETVYRFAIPGSTQQSGRIRVNINHYTAGTLRIEARRGAETWSAVGTLDGAKLAGAFDLPAALFPAPTIDVRLALTGPGNLQVNACDYEALLANPPSDTEGETHFLEIRQTIAGLGVELDDLGLPADDGRCRMKLRLTTNPAKPRRLEARVQARYRSRPGHSEPVGRSQRLRVSRTLEAELDGGPATTDLQSLEVHLRDTTDSETFVARIDTQIGFLEDSSFGYPLRGNRHLDLWWCESGWKVGRNRRLPATKSAASALSVSAARGEYEAAQLVLRPQREATLEAVDLEPFKDSTGQPTSIRVRIDEVAYVHVEHPTDGTSRRGWYPDPLPPLELPLALSPERNQPLWLTFFVPYGTKAGSCTSAIRLRTSLGEIRVPVRVRVYGFDMPRDTHLHSALGLGAGGINRYHRLEDPHHRQTVFEKYLKNFAEHRISPYSFYDYASFQVGFEGEGTDQRARVDFTKFDQAATKWLDEYRFNTFQLPLQGMGGGTFHSLHLGQLAGFQEGTPEHARLFRDYLGQVEAHLRQRGWLDHAFTYWFDEPDPKDYEFVVAGMKRLKEAAPGIRRMLTEQPEPELRGQVEIWCGLTPEWTPEKVKACREAGEDVWWYICTAPKAPYVTEFIDHPGTELRLWPWQSWQYGVRGLLIWATIYWSSPLVYPTPNTQDPWKDPMSWVSGYGFPVGHRSAWGNGDGRFLYPPRRDPNTATDPCLDDPINSLRWENLRDGMEDYEYLWLLQNALERTPQTDATRRLAAEARMLLEVPDDISKDLTHFTTDPRPILAHRDRIARMIETLDPASSGGTKP